MVQLGPKNPDAGHPVADAWTCRIKIYSHVLYLLIYKYWLGLMATLTILASEGPDIDRREAEGNIL